MSIPLHAYWVTCTPAWVARWNLCGGTVRRPILIPLAAEQEGCAPRFEVVGHEHLMHRPGFSFQAFPVDHKDGAPR